MKNINRDNTLLPPPFIIKTQKREKRYEVKPTTRHPPSPRRRRPAPHRRRSKKHEQGQSAGVSEP
jgi:hypothetical protein